MLNDPAKFMAFAGFIAGIFGWMLLIWLIGDGRTTKAMGFYVAGGTIVLFNLGLRAIQNKEDGLARFISPLCGGRFVVFPAWLAGIGVAIGGVLVQISDS